MDFKNRVHLFVVHRRNLKQSQRKVESEKIKKLPKKKLTKRNLV